MLDIFKFYGSDWLGMAFQFLGMYFISRKNKYGFLAFAMGNFAWITYALITGSLAHILANLIVGGISIYGYINWDKKNGKK